MRVLTDQDVYQLTLEFLQSLGHDVLRARDLGLSAASDTALLERARQDRRVLVTRDKGYGALAFVAGQAHAGIVLLRVTPGTLEGVHQELRRFFAEHPAIEMTGHVVVIEPGRHRIRASKGTV